MIYPSYLRSCTVSPVDSIRLALVYGAQDHRHEDLESDVFLVLSLRYYDPRGGIGTGPIELGVCDGSRTGAAMDVSDVGGDGRWCRRRSLWWIGQ